MSWRVQKAVWQHSKQSGGRLVLLLAMADIAGNDDGTGIWASQAHLAGKARMSVRNVFNCLKKLEEAGEIAKDGTHHTGTQKWRITLPGLTEQEKISTPPEKTSGSGVEKIAGGGGSRLPEGVEAGFRRGWKPASTKPSENPQRTKKEPSRAHAREPFSNESAHDGEPDRLTRWQRDQEANWLSTARKAGML